VLKRANALHTLIRQRHPTPSCGGHAPTAERTLDPARMFTESLTPAPELENDQDLNGRPQDSLPWGATAPASPPCMMRIQIASTMISVC
jgi:hypothetical protein